MPGDMVAAPPLRDSTRAILESFGLAVDEARRGAFYRAGWWRSRTALDDFDDICRTHAGKTAVVTYQAGCRDPHRISYRDLAACVRRTAAAFVGLGVEPGDVVSAQLPNWWQFPVVALAAQRVGAVFNPILPIHRRREVTFITALLGSKVCVVPHTHRRFGHARMLAEVASAVPALRHRIVTGGDAGPGELSFERDVLGQPWEHRYGGELAARALDADCIADVQFTSGTTGEPKGVGHTHNTQYARARAVYETLELTEDDTVFMPSTLAHSTGFVYGCMTPLMRGMTAVYQDVWDPVRALDIIGAEQAAWTFGSTSFIVDLLRAHREHPSGISCLRYFVAGGAKIPPAVVAQARGELGARLIAVWGMTENGAVTFTHLDEPVLAAAESDGKPCPWMELKVADPGTGAALPAGAEGELLVRGASQMLGYVRRPALTAAAFDPDGWFATGDVARLDAGGHVRITGRAKDIIIRGGENIPVAEIEALLYEHPDIAEAAVVAYPDDRLGERACAVVVPVPGATPTLADLTAHLELAGMSRTYWPERIEVREEMPRTLSGKVQKFRLRESLEPLARSARAGEPGDPSGSTGPGTGRLSGSHRRHGTRHGKGEAMTATATQMWVLEGATMTFDKGLVVVGGSGEVTIPTPSFLVQHPRGLVLFDTGLCPDAVLDPEGVYGPLTGALGLNYTEDMLLEKQLAVIGFRPSDVTHVVISHAHFDHVGALRLFGDAKVFIGAEDLPYAYWPLPAGAPFFRIADLDVCRSFDWKPLTGDHDLFGDGSIQILKLPGHTPGNTSSLVRLPHRSFMLTGDTVHLREALAGDLPMGADWNTLESVRSIRRLKQVAEAAGATIWTLHDPQDWAELRTGDVLT